MPFLHVVVAVVVLIVVAALGGAAGAQDRAEPTFVKDRRGDASGPLDAVRVALLRTSDGKLRGEVTMAEAWTADDLRDGTAPGSVCLRLHERRAADAQPAEHLVCATAPAEGEKLVGRVLSDRANGLPKTVGEATVSRPTERTVFVRFAQTAVGKPATVRFSAETVTRGEGCPRTLGCRDTAPDAPATGVLTLRRTPRSG